MARPNKETLDYFQHDSDSSKKKTLRIMFNHFQHEGISFWWQLLEQISANRNLVIDLRNPDVVEDLASQMRFTPERMLEMIDKLASLDAIDRLLWGQKIIWCQNLIDRHEDVFKRWKNGTPIKPELMSTETQLMSTETQENNTIIPQIKRKEIKRKEINNGLFDIFYEAYPVKKSKGDAERAFIKLKPDQELVDKMVKAIQSQKKERKRLRSLHQFVPEWKHPATWLNKKCWEDEYSDTGNNGRFPTKHLTPEEIINRETRSDLPTPEEL